MTSKRSTLQEDTQFRVLRLLQENPEMSQREVADRVGISVGGTHYVLSALIEKALPLPLWRQCAATISSSGSSSISISSSIGGSTETDCPPTRPCPRAINPIF